MALDTSPVPDEETISQTGPAASESAPDLAEVDLLISRPDPGPGCATLIVAGDPIPPQLATLPCRPYTPSVILGKPNRRRT